MCVLGVEPNFYALKILKIICFYAVQFRQNNLYKYSFFRKNMIFHKKLLNNNMPRDSEESRDNDEYTTLEAALVAKPVGGTDAFAGRGKLPPLAAQPQLAAVPSENRPENELEIVRDGPRPPLLLHRQIPVTDQPVPDCPQSGFNVGRSAVGSLFLHLLAMAV